MKNKKLFFKIYILLVIITIISFIALSILGNKTRVGYLQPMFFTHNLEETLRLNNLENIKTNLIVDKEFDEEKWTNYLFILFLTLFLILLIGINHTILSTALFKIYILSLRIFICITKYSKFFIKYFYYLSLSITTIEQSIILSLF